MASIKSEASASSSRASTSAGAKTSLSQQENTLCGLKRSASTLETSISSIITTSNSCPASNTRSSVKSSLRKTVSVQVCGANPLVSEGLHLPNSSVVGSEAYANLGQKVVNHRMDSDSEGESPNKKIKLSKPVSNSKRMGRNRRNRNHRRGYGCGSNAEQPVDANSATGTFNVTRGNAGRGSENSARGESSNQGLHFASRQTSNASMAEGLNVGTLSSAPQRPYSPAGQNSRVSLSASPINSAGGRRPFSGTQRSSSSENRRYIYSRAQRAVSSGSRGMVSSGSRGMVSSGAREFSSSGAREFSSSGSRAWASSGSRAWASSGSRGSASSGSRPWASSGSRGSASSGSRGSASSGSRPWSSSGSRGSASSSSRGSASSGSRGSASSGARGSASSRAQRLVSTGERRSASTGARGSASTGARGPGSTGARGPGSTGARGPGSTGARGPGSTGARGSGSTGARGSGSTGARGSGSTGARGSGSIGARGSASTGARESYSSVARGSFPAEVHGSSSLGVHGSSSSGTCGFSSTAVQVTISRAGPPLSSSNHVVEVSHSNSKSPYNTRSKSSAQSVLHPVPSQVRVMSPPARIQIRTNTSTENTANSFIFNPRAKSFVPRCRFLEGVPMIPRHYYDRGNARFSSSTRNPANQVGQNTSPQILLEPVTVGNSPATPHNRNQTNTSETVTTPPMFEVLSSSGIISPLRLSLTTSTCHRSAIASTSTTNINTKPKSSSFSNNKKPRILGPTSSDNIAIRHIDSAASREPASNSSLNISPSNNFPQSENSAFDESNKYSASSFTHISASGQYDTIPSVIPSSPSYSSFRSPSSPTYNREPPSYGLYLSPSSPIYGPDPSPSSPRYGPDPSPSSPMYSRYSPDYSPSLPVPVPTIASSEAPQIGHVTNSSNNNMLNPFAPITPVNQEGSDDISGPSTVAPPMIQVPTSTMHEGNGILSSKGRPPTPITRSPQHPSVRPGNTIDTVARDSDNQRIESRRQRIVAVLYDMGHPIVNVLMNNNNKFALDHFFNDLTYADYVTLVSTSNYQTLLTILPGDFHQRLQDWYEIYVAQPDDEMDDYEDEENYDNFTDQYDYDSDDALVPPQASGTIFSSSQEVGSSFTINNGNGSGSSDSESGSGSRHCNCVERNCSCNDGTKSAIHNKESGSESKDSGSEGKDSGSCGNDSGSNDKVSGSDGKVSGSDGNNCGSDGNNCDSDGNNCGSDGNNCGSDGNNCGSDGNGSGSDGKESSSDNNNSGSDGKESSSDSNDSGSDGRESGSDSKESGSDSKDSGSDNDGSDSDSEESSPDAEESTSSGSSESGCLESTGPRSAPPPLLMPEVPETVEVVVCSSHERKISL